MALPLRQADLLDLGSTGRSLAHTQSFCIERLYGAAGSRVAFTSATEAILLLPFVGAHLSGDHEAELPGHAVVIVPGGSHAVELAASGEVYILSTDRSDTDATGAPPRDERVRPVGTPRKRLSGAGEVHIHPVARHRHSARQRPAALPPERDDEHQLGRI